MTAAFQREGPRIVAGVLALLVGASGHFHGHWLYLDRLNTPDPELPPPAAPPAARVDRPARRLWILLVDGLPYPEALELPNIGRIAREGASRSVRPDHPTFTYPAVVTIATGLPPRWSGVRINAAGPFARWDSVFARAADEGLAVAVDSGSFADLLALLQLPERFDRTRAEDLIARAPAPDRRELALVYFGDADDAGHTYGTRSRAYLDAIARGDQLAGLLFAHLDPAEDALLILSDHGHLENGGHGGLEEGVMQATFIAAGGPFLRSAPLPESALRHVAPTIAAALAIPPPRSSIGTAMLDVFGLGPARGDDPSRHPERAEEAAFAARAWVRLALAALALLFLSAGARRLRLRLALHDLAPFAAYTAGFGVFYFARGYTWSWSLPSGGPGFYADTLVAGIIGAALALVAARRSRRVEEALVMAAAFAVPYVLAGAWVGLDAGELAGPRSSYAVILIATLEFYACIPFGIRALLGARTSSTGPAVSRGR